MVQHSTGKTYQGKSKTTQLQQPLDKTISRQVQNVRMQIVWGQTALPRCSLLLQMEWCGLLARLQTWRALIFSAEFVCLSVCLWPALLPFNVDRFWRNLVTRTPLWSSLAATIMVQIGRRVTTGHLYKNLKKFSKITKFEFQNSGPSFFVSVSPVYYKKIWTRFEQNWRRR